MEPGKGKWLGKELSSVGAVVIRKCWQGTSGNFCRSQSSMPGAKVPADPGQLPSSPASLPSSLFSPFHKQKPRQRKCSHRQLSTPSSYPQCQPPSLSRHWLATFQYFISSPHCTGKDNRGHREEEKELNGQGLLWFQSPGL